MVLMQSRNGELVTSRRLLIESMNVGNGTAPQALLAHLDQERSAAPLVIDLGDHALFLRQVRQDDRLVAAQPHRLLDVQVEALLPRHRLGPVPEHRHPLALPAALRRRPARAPRVRRYFKPVSAMPRTNRHHRHGRRGHAVLGAARGFNPAEMLQFRSSSA